MNAVVHLLKVHGVVLTAMPGDGLDQYHRRQLSQGATASQQALQVHHHVHNHAKKRGRGKHLRIHGVGYHERQFLPGESTRRFSKAETVHAGPSVTIVLNTT